MIQIPSFQQGACRTASESHWDIQSPIQLGQLGSVSQPPPILEDLIKITFLHLQGHSLDTWSKRDKLLFSWSLPEGWVASLPDSDFTPTVEMLTFRGIYQGQTICLH